MNSPRGAEACRITVSIAHAGAGGATTFNFDDDRVTAEMHVEGELDRLLADIVPHEVTHVVMADFFKKPLPRWADEGIALLSESEEEQARQAGRFAEAANAVRLIQLKALCPAREYPTDVAAFFAESYYLAKTLVDRKDRATLLGFVRDGMKDGWEPAAKTHYGTTLDELERAMLEKVKAEVRRPRGRETGGPGPAGPRLRHGQRRPVRGRHRLPAEPVVRAGHEVYQARGDGQERSSPELFRAGDRVPAAVGIEQAAVVCPGRGAGPPPSGRAVEEAALIDALKGKPVPVVLAMEADSLDKAFADLLKPDTLILVVPPEKDELRPPPTRAAGGEVDHLPRAGWTRQPGA